MKSWVLVSLSLLVASNAFAADRHWNIATGTWASSASWNPAAVPGVLDNAIIDYWDYNAGTGGLARISTGTNSAVSSVSISNGAVVRISNQGSLLCGGDFIVGSDNTLGSLNVTSTSPFIPFFGGLSVGANLRLGVQSGVGLVNQSDGTVAIGGSLKVGDVSQSGSAFTSAGTYNLTGGTLRAQNIEVGRDYRSAGTFNLAGFSNASADYVNVGAYEGAGVLNQTGGTMWAKTQLTIGDQYGVGGTYNLSGGTLNSGTTVLNQHGVMNISGGTASLGDVTLWGGRINLAGGGSASFHAYRVSLNHPIYGSIIDLNDGRMMLAGSTSVNMDAIGQAYNGGGWDGAAGITSSAARAVAASGSPHRTGIGAAFVGSEFTVGYTLMGDANFDHKVDLTDFTLLAGTFNRYGDWYFGDFNYDTKVDLTDFTMLASNFNQSLPAASAGLGAAVPEPSCIVWLPCAVMLRHRRQRASPRQRVA